MTERRTDHVFIALFSVLLVIGFVVLTSATGPNAYQKFNDPYWYLKHQALFGLLPGLVGYVIMSRVDYRSWRGSAVACLVASLALLGFVFIPGIGAQWGTSHSWIGVAGVSLQPLEVVKLLFLLYLAASLEGAATEGTVDAAVPKILLATVLVAGLLVMQPNLGGAVIILSIAGSMLLLAGASWRMLAGIAVGCVALVLLMIVVAPYRLERLKTFINPKNDTLGVGYHVNQALLAVGSGGWFGLGLGHSRQKYLYLPEVAGDSIFAVLAEELGFIVSFGVVLLFAAFLLRGMRISRRAPDMYGRLVAGGVVAWIGTQALVNIGSMVGLFPLTGLPLPFVSYGGTALMMLLCAVGMMSNISSFAAAT